MDPRTLNITRGESECGGHAWESRVVENTTIYLRLGNGRQLTLVESSIAVTVGAAKTDSSPSASSRYGSILHWTLLVSARMMDIGQVAVSVFDHFFSTSYGLGPNSFSDSKSYDSPGFGILL